MKYFTLTDIINTAISKNFQPSKKKETNELSLHIINDMTYNNIWNVFVKWCVDQSELGFLLNIFPLGTMYYVADKQYEGISIKLSDTFLKEHDLKWDETKFYYDKLQESKFNSSVAQVQKLNLLAITSELNLPKVYVQAGLTNIFKSIGHLLSSNSVCLIDLGLLGNLYSSNGMISHIPTKLKKETIFNKKTTIKTLIGKYQDEEKILNTKENDEITKSNKIIIKGPENSNAHHFHNMAKSSEKLNDHKTTFERMRLSIKLPEKDDFHINKKEEKITFDYLPSPIKKPKQHSNQHSNNRKGKQLLIPLRDQEWNLKDMINSTFKRADRIRRSNSPVLFNAYSNTKAAPFTSEKTQIPIAHRIGSFYSLPLQNFIIDSTTKTIKKLFDEYFYKYKNIIFDVPANEKEEYLYIFNPDSIDSKKIALRRETYERYLNYIYKNISDDCISDIKESWLVNIVKMCLRAYNLNNPNKYNDLLNECIKEIVLTYKISMKKSILDYILKHPEQREKLNIPVSFRTLKEYAEDRITRPSDNNNEWKRNWNLSKLRISNNLMIMCENVTKILKYYIKNLQSTSYLELNNSEWTGCVKLTNFIDNQKAKIEDEKTIVNDEWKKYVENILKENKIYKDQLIMYFKSVSGLMSSQLRKLIISSLEKYHDFIQQFKRKKYHQPKTVFNDQFKPKFFFERSFIEVEINASHDGSSFCFSDELSDIHNKLIGLVHEIVKCSQDVERPDNMFIKNLEKRTNLWELPINDSVVSGIIADIDLTIKENLDTINKVTQLYEPFVFVLSEQSALEKFKYGSSGSSNNVNSPNDKNTMNPNLNFTPPKREDIRKRIKFYEDKLKILREDMPNCLYMNMIKINCTEINKTLREMLYDYIIDLLKYVHHKNINGKSKDLIDRIEKLRVELSMQANDEETLSKLENDLEYKNELVKQLYNDYNDMIEWIFFYLEYDIYPIFPDSGKETVGGLETVIKNTHLTVKLISGAMDTYETNLKEKRAQFEVQLNKTRAAVNNIIQTLRKDVENIKENAQSQYHGDETGALFLSNLKALEKRTQEAQLLLTSLMRREELLGSYPTEDDTIDQCFKDLEPMINYVSFYCDYRSVQADMDYYEIRSVDFPQLMALIDRSDLFDISIQKIPSLKPRIIRVKNEFDSFKSAVELGKHIYTFIDILKYEHLSEDNKSLYEDNNFYCMELYKILFSSDNKDVSRAQEIFKNMKLKDLLQNRAILDKYAKHKLEIEKLVHEWENVRHMYDILAKIAVNVDIDFKTENFKDKKYVVIPHDNYALVRSQLIKNVQIAEDNIALVENSKDKINILKKVTDYKRKLVELIDIIEKMETNQLSLEKHMLKSIVLQKKNTDMFLKLKQAEKDFKILIDYVIEKTKIMSILAVKDFFKETLNSISKVLAEIPSNYDE